MFSFQQFAFEVMPDMLHLTFQCSIFFPSDKHRKQICRKLLRIICILQSKEQMCRITDLQDELRHREHHISDLDKEVQHLHENISALTKELEFKGKEILRIRSESNQQMRYVCHYYIRMNLQCYLTDCCDGIQQYRPIFMTRLSSNKILKTTFDLVDYFIIQNVDEMLYFE